LIRRKAIFFLHTNNNRKANNYLEKYNEVLNYHSVTEAEIVSRIANVYWEADLLDEAEDAFRQVLKEFDETPSGLNDLAGFLIETGRDVDNGLELIKEALNADPNQWYYLHTKGWGLFKSGKYDEALNTLYHAWDHSPLYDQNLYRHIKVVEKALASQNQ
ncbi:MAG: hypothetical protein MUO54_13820, partial [Anaerolineales bacterium]|nr:hypothetical protein [Anaerolineales bacterium]